MRVNEALTLMIQEGSNRQTPIATQHLSMHTHAHARTHRHTQTHRHRHTHAYIYIYIYIHTLCAEVVQQSLALPSLNNGRGKEKKILQYRSADTYVCTAPML